MSTACIECVSMVQLYRHAMCGTCGNRIIVFSHISAVKMQCIAVEFLTHTIIVTFRLLLLLAMTLCVFILYCIQ